MSERPRFSAFFVPFGPISSRVDSARLQSIPGWRRLGLRCDLRLVVLLMSAVFGANASAAGEVSSVLTELQPATPLRYTVGGQDYTWGLGSNQIMTGIVAEGERYGYADALSRVELRRDDIAGVASGNPCGVMVERLDGQGFTLAADYPSDGSGTGNCDMEELLASRVFNRGVVDLFSNVVPDAKNIERADFIFDQGLLAPLDVGGLARAGHVVGDKSGNNPLQMAAILGLDVFGQPQTYGPLVRVVPVGCTDPNICFAQSGPSTPYALLQNQFLIPQGFPSVTEVSMESGAMALVTTENLGLAAGQRYFGFSLFADDVDSDLHTLTDPATYPDDTGVDSPVPGDGADVFGGLAGYFLADSLSVASGHVFLDTDGDGIFSESDAAISDVGVVVHADSDANGVFDPAIDLLLHDAIDSGLNGAFQLPGLADGSYFVVLDEADSDIPAGLTLAAGNNPVAVLIASNDADNVDFVFVSDGSSGNGGTDTGGTDTGGTFGDPATTAISDSYTINQGETLIASVLDNDVDAAGEGLTITAVSESPNATINIIDDTVVYTPDYGFYGTDTFMYTVQDSDVDESTGTVTVSVERFSDIDGNGINDFEQCDAVGVDCSNLRLETGVHGSGVGVFGWQSLAALIALFGLSRIRRRPIQRFAQSERSS